MYWESCEYDQISKICGLSTIFKITVKWLYLEADPTKTAKECYAQEFRDQRCTNRFSVFVESMCMHCCWPFISLETCLGRGIRGNEAKTHCIHKVILLESDPEVGHSFVAMSAIFDPKFSEKPTIYRVHATILTLCHNSYAMHFCVLQDIHSTIHCVMSSGSLDEFYCHVQQNYCQVAGLQVLVTSVHIWCSGSPICLTGRCGELVSWIISLTYNHSWGKSHLTTWLSLQQDNHQLHPHLWYLYVKSYQLYLN